MLCHRDVGAPAPTGSAFSVWGQSARRGVSAFLDRRPSIPRHPASSWRVSQPTFYSHAPARASRKCAVYCLLYQTRFIFVDINTKNVLVDGIRSWRSSMVRMRSPNYPSIPLRQAVELARKIHSLNRTNIIDRDVAVRDMGYSGVTGRSLKVLAALIQYGLLSKSGNGSVRVTQTAVDILHGIDETDRNAALLRAGREPSLFKMIFERFPDGVPSENAIRSYLIQQGFADVAIGPAIRSFMETYHDLESIQEGDEHIEEDNPESTEPPQAQENKTQPAAGPAAPSLPASFASPVPTELNKINMDIRGDQVLISGLLDARGLNLLEKKIAALKLLLAVYTEPNDTGDGEDSEVDE